MESSEQPPRHRPLRDRFNLRRLFAVVTCCAVVLGLGRIMVQALRPDSGLSNTAVQTIFGFSVLGCLLALLGAFVALFGRAGPRILGCVCWGIMVSGLLFLVLGAAIVWLIRGIFGVLFEP